MKKNVLDFNKLPQQIESGELSVQQGVHKLAEFILENKPLYGLGQFDDDFIHDLILNFLENGHHIFEKFDSECGTFFNYFYNYIKNLVFAKFRKEDKKNLIENFNTSESIFSYSDIIESYSKMDYGFMEEAKVPYCAKKVTPEQLKSAFKIPCIKVVDNKHRFVLTHVRPEKKALLVISLKSAFYLDDDNIKLLSDVFNIQQEDFYTVIQEIKDSLNLRMTRRFELEEKRNRIYYKFCKYETLSKKAGQSSEKQKLYSEKATTQQIKLAKINDELHKGIINIRPSNKVISEIVGISERQISYYLKIANNSEEFKKLIGNEIIFNNNSDENKA